jgi:hypothetical protein
MALKLNFLFLLLTTMFPFLELNLNFLITFAKFLTRKINLNLYSHRKNFYKIQILNSRKNTLNKNKFFIARTLKLLLVTNYSIRS